MFEALEKTAFFNIIKENASDIIIKDRLKYKNIYFTVEKYCKENQDLIISDIKKLLDKEDKFTFMKYEIYCENPYKHAITIANEIYTNVGKWVQMNTIIPYQEFQIWYDTRLVVSIIKLVKGKEIDLNSLINPISIVDINYMSPEIEIIDVYKRLYLPNYSKEWKDLFDIEVSLENLVKHRMETMGGDIIGKNPVIYRQKTDIEKLKLLIFNDYIVSEPQKNTQIQHVVIGHWAINVAKSMYHNQNMESHVEKIQIISTNVLEDIKAIKIILENHSDLALIHKQHTLHLPKDFRVKRYTLYLSGHNIKEVPFMDIFNSAEFELIPYNIIQLDASEFSNKLENSQENSNKINKIVKIGNPYVLLRFAMIDLWILRVINKIGNIHPKSLLAKIRSLYELIDTVKNGNIKELKLAFGVNYIGTNVDYESAKKLENLGKQQGNYKNQPYIPSLAQKLGKYRVVH